MAMKREHGDSEKMLSFGRAEEDVDRKQMKRRNKRVTINGPEDGIIKVSSWDHTQMKTYCTKLNITNCSIAKKET